MRFAVAHKAATYLMVTFAYLAMIAGGGVGPLVALAGIVGLVGSWWWEPPNIRFEKWTWVWTTLSVFALVYSILTAVVTSDFLGVGAQFLIWLVVAKAYNRRAARDWQQMYLLSFLMLVAGSVLNADLTYGLCFLGFVIASTWAMTLFHLRREMEDNLLVKHAADRASERVEVRRILDSKRIVGGRFFLGTGILSFGVFLIAAIVFLAIPRVGFGFFLKSHHGPMLTGFSDRVQLGGHGVLKSDPTVIMRVEISPDVGGRDKPEIHWRGVAFDEYSHGRWSRTNLAPKTRWEGEVLETGIDRYLIAWQDAQWARKALDNGVKQSIWLEPLDSDVVFGASNPRIFETAAIARKRKYPQMRNDEMRIEHGSTLHYTVWSDMLHPTPDELRAATGAMPGTYSVYLQLPDEITAETKALAHKITDGLPTSYDKAVAIERWLKTNLSYTLELKEPGRTEPVHFFLFDRKKGHCEYFASAFVVLARIAGIPTRQVNGFLGGEWNEYQNYVAVRAGDAHSWAEVYFPGKGWVTFDPTPSDNAGLGRGGTGWRAKLGRLIDTLRFQWSKWVIEYDLVAQLSLFSDIGHVLKVGAKSVRDALVFFVNSWGLLGLALAAVAAVILLRRRRRGDALEPARAIARPRSRSPIAAIYDQVQKHLAKAGIRRDAGMTPRELADRRMAKGDAGAAELRELTELYYAAEWGGRRDPAAEQRAGELAIAIRTALRDADRAAR